MPLESSFRCVEVEKPARQQPAELRRLRKFRSLGSRVQRELLRKAIDIEINFAKQIIEKTEYIQRLHR
jgi:hypothetical protein